MILIFGCDRTWLNSYFIFHIHRLFARDKLNVLYIFQRILKVNLNVIDPSLLLLNLRSSKVINSWMTDLPYACPWELLLLRDIFRSWVILFNLIFLRLTRKMEAILLKPFLIGLFSQLLCRFLFLSAQHIFDRDMWSKIRINFTFLCCQALIRPAVIESLSWCQGELFIGGCFFTLLLRY